MDIIPQQTNKTRWIFKHYRHPLYRQSKWNFLPFEFFLSKITNHLEVNFAISKKKFTKWYQRMHSMWKYRDEVTETSVVSSNYMLRENGVASNSFITHFQIIRTNVSNSGVYDIIVKAQFCSHSAPSYK